MNLYEFQAKELLARFGILVPRGRLAESSQDAERVASRLGFADHVVKAQIHAGDRARAGGVRFAATPDAVGRVAAELVGRPLVTPQTGAGGQRVRWVYIEERVAALRHLYAAVTLDRSAGRLVLLVGGAGGDDIEARAAREPGVVRRFPLILAAGGVEGDFEAAAGAMGLEGAAVGAAAGVLRAMVAAAVALDATQVEINPLALLADGRLVALDAKVTIDDNALFRHGDLARLREATIAEDGDPVELAADAHQLNYLRMDGDVGVVVNGAGLALATLDALVEAGAAPANFMDIRTTASSLDIAYGFGLILANPRVKRVLVNIHGGGMQRCDTVADGIGIAASRSAVRPRIVVRFAGNNAAFGLERLASCGIAFETAADIGDAVRRLAGTTRQEAA
jgi:succinyl-CoA synthetase beta subunit